MANDARQLATSEADASNGAERPATPQQYKLDALQPNHKAYIDTTGEYVTWLQQAYAAREQPAKEYIKAIRLNHPRRCQADLSKARPHEPICYRFAIKGSRYCKLHGAVAELSGKTAYHTHVLPMFYSTKLTGTLAEFFENHLDQPATEQIQLMEEIALYRSTLMPIVALYNGAYNSGNPEAIATATALLRDGIEGLSGLLHTVSKIRANEKGAISIHTVVDITQQIVRLIYKYAPDDIARNIEAGIRDQVKIAFSQAEGTTLTPDQIDQTVIAMDATIPARPSLNNVGNGKFGNGKH